MRAQANRYSISLAPTGRARCRACKRLVARGAVRLVTLAVVSERPRRVTTFVRHGTCVNAAFADGRVQFLSESIDSKVYMNLFTPQGSRLQGLALDAGIASGNF